MKRLFINVLLSLMMANSTMSYSPLHLIDDIDVLDTLRRRYEKTIANFEHRINFLEKRRIQLDNSFNELNNRCGKKSESEGDTPVPTQKSSQSPIFQEYVCYNELINHKKNLEQILFQKEERIKMVTELMAELSGINASLRIEKEASALNNTIISDKDEKEPENE
jgi:exonuclease VII small subunit